jgi:hypothetical protein
MSEADQTDLEIIEGMLEDYGLTPADSIADLIEAINDADQEG